MPANLPPHYFEAEKRFREAKKPEGKIEALEEMLMIMPKHKGTDKLRAEVRKKISKFKSQSQQKKSVSRRETAYSIDKEGAAQVVLVGSPNTGKSSLLSSLTKAKPEIAAFPHSTWKPTPGMVPYENIQFQLVDTPPLTIEYVDPWLADLIRRAEIVAIQVDIKGDPIEQFHETMSLVNGLRIFPQGYPIPKDLKKPPFLKKMFLLVNKVDEETDEEDYEIFKELSETTLPCLPISTLSGRNLKKLPEMIYDIAEIIRVYTKGRGKKADLNSPFVVPRESTLEDLAGRIHKDFVRDLKYARIWGQSVYDGQMIQRDYILQEGDIVEIHT